MIEYNDRVGGWDLILFNDFCFTDLVFTVFIHPISEIARLFSGFDLWISIRVSPNSVRLILNLPTSGSSLKRVGKSPASLSPSSMVALTGQDPSWIVGMSSLNMMNSDEL